MKRLILSLSICLLSVLSASPNAVAQSFDESQLQTLFTDKKQRDYIDAVRAGRNNKDKKTEKIHLQGYVTRSHGKSVVWVNNRSTLEGDHLGDVHIHTRTAGKKKSVVITSEGRSRRLKPGETWNKQSGDVGESY